MAALELPSTYTLDASVLRLNAYRLLCLFYANKEISRQADPAGDGTSISGLQKEYFPREMTRLLLNIAISLRVLDDQMWALPAANEERQRYLARRDDVNHRRKSMMTFDDMSLRGVCNKIVHARVVEPHSTSGGADHEIDHRNSMAWSYACEASPSDAGPHPDPVEWSHLSGYIRLGGTMDGKEWWHLLDLPEFISGVYEVLSAAEQTHAASRDT
jgi:hypothetical protein